MATLTATYHSDLGRVELTAGDLDANVIYSIERSTEFEPTWVPVRGAQNISTTGVTVVNDYEYTPNMENFYRLVGPSFYDSFARAYPSSGALDTPGTDFNYARSLDNAAFDIVGDIDIRTDIVADTWPVAVNATLVGKYNDNTNNRSYRLDVLTSGLIRFAWSDDGINVVNVSSTVEVPIETGDRIALRATLDVNNGAGGRTITFYTAPTIAGPWTQLGAPVVQAGVTSIFSGTANLEIGARADGDRDPFAGLTFASQVYNGIAGVLVANPNFAAQAPGTTMFVDSVGRTWNLLGTAEIVTHAPVPGTSWGTADTGQVWATGSSLPGFFTYVDNGVGVIGNSTPAGTSVEMDTVSVGVTDGELTWSATYPNSAILLDVPVEWAVGFRAQDWNNTYESNLQFRPSGDDYDVRLRIGKFVANAFTFLGTITLGTWTTGVPWNVRFRIVGDVLSAKAWEEGSSEPGGWQLNVTDTSFPAAGGMFVRGYKASGIAYEQWFGPIALNAIPTVALASASVTPTEDEVFLKSVQYPSLNKILDCVNWDALSRDSRAGFFDIKGRHEILAITDVGSSATFNLTFVTRSKAENRAIVALLTFGGVLLLQPPGDDESEECSVAYSGIPGGYVVPSTHVQAHAMLGRALWSWTVQFTQVAAPDESIVGTTITWEQLWEIIGPDGTWEDVWATWPTWQALWSTQGSSEAFFEN
jgi:hypothetical protein